jgi:hypothetical protein
MVLLDDGAEAFSETLDLNSILTRLISRDDFIYSPWNLKILHSD